MSETTTATQEVPAEIERFDIIFRIQHVLMFTTFLLLSFTGWGLKFAHEPQGLSSVWIRVWGGAEMAGLIHRIAGVGMLLDFIWHVIYLAYLFATKQMTINLKTTVIPLPKDVVDVVKNFMYFLGPFEGKGEVRKIFLCTEIRLLGGLLGYVHHRVFGLCAGLSDAGILHHPPVCIRMDMAAPLAHAQ